MADEKDHAGSEGRSRERMIRAKVDKAQTGEARSGLTRGRIGVSAPKSPKKWPAVGERPPAKGEGKKAYGPPMSTPKPKPVQPRPDVKPDPLKAK
jgi:hypothetical protein